MGELKEEDDERGKGKRAVQAVHCGMRWQTDAPRRYFVSVSWCLERVEMFCYS